jgi:hypothetical protein
MVGVKQLVDFTPVGPSSTFTSMLTVSVVAGEDPGREATQDHL